MTTANRLHLHDIMLAGSLDMAVICHFELLSQAFCVSYLPKDSGKEREKGVVRVLRQWKFAIQCSCS